MLQNLSIGQRLLLIILLSLALLVVATINNLQPKTNVETCLIDKKNSICSRGAFYTCQLLTLFPCQAYRNLENNHQLRKSDKGASS